jgi:hypothetical protein
VDQKPLLKKLFLVATRTCRSFGIHFDDCDTAIKTAISTDLVRLVSLTALGTQTRRWRNQKIVCSAHAFARYGMTAFWMGHDYITFQQKKLKKTVHATLGTGYITYPKRNEESIQYRSRFQHIALKSL